MLWEYIIIDALSRISQSLLSIFYWLFNFLVTSPCRMTLLAASKLRRKFHVAADAGLQLWMHRLSSLRSFHIEKVFDISFTHALYTTAAAYLLRRLAYLRYDHTYGSQPISQQISRRVAAPGWHAPGHWSIWKRPKQAWRRVSQEAKMVCFVFAKLF